MKQLTKPGGRCKRSSENILIFFFPWQRPCTYRQAVGDWVVHCNDGKLNQFFFCQICSPPCPVQLIALEIPNLEDHSKYKYASPFKNVLRYLFHDVQLQKKKPPSSISLAKHFGLILNPKPKSQHFGLTPPFYGYLILGIRSNRGWV